MTDDTPNEESIDENNKKVSSKKKKIKKPKKKWNRKKITFWTIGSLVALFMYWATQPVYIQGSQFFGVCRTYIELNVQYPSELRFVDIRERQLESTKEHAILDVTVEYMTLDSFGQHLAHRGTCLFKKYHKDGQIALDHFYLRRGVKDRGYKFAIEDPKKVADFNLTVPFLLQQDLNLIIRGPSRYLGDLTPAQ